MQQVYVYGADDVRLESASVPEVGPDDALIGVAACGICGSDLAYIAMGGLMGPAGEPMPLGHELAGRVLALGENVSDFRIGQRVVVNPLAADNNIGNGGREGGFTEQLLVRNVTADKALFPLPDTLSDEHGALVEPLGVALHAVNQAALNSGDKVVIFGAGPIGLGAVVAARYRGVSNIVAVDLSQTRLDIARALGASETVHASGDVWSAIKAVQGETAVHGMPAADSDVFIDAAGVPAVFRGILDNCKFGARIVVVAMHKEEAPQPLFQIMAKELIIKGAMAYPDEFDEVIEMLGSVDVLPMITHRFPLDRFIEALETARQPDKAGKVLVTMQD